MSKQSKKILWLVGAIGGGIVFSLPTLAQTTTNQPVPNAQRYQPQENNQNMNSDRQQSRPMNSDRTTPSNSMGGMNNQNQNMNSGNNNRSGSSANQLSRQTQGGAALNPCPSIFYEPQFRGAVPAGCPANSTSGTGNVNRSLSERDQTAPSQQNQMTPNRDRKQNNQSVNPGTNAQPATATIPSLQQQLGEPSARINTTNGVASVTLVNSTAANIRFQVIGDTNQRVLPGKSYVTLQALRTPTTITFNRQDQGLINVITRPSSQPGTLAVELTEATRLGADKKAMNIQATGEVFVY